MPWLLLHVLEDPAENIRSRSDAIAFCPQVQISPFSSNLCLWLKAWLISGGSYIQIIVAVVTFNITWMHCFWRKETWAVCLAHLQVSVRCQQSIFEIAHCMYIVWQLHSFIQTHNELRHGFCRVRNWWGIDCLKDFVESGKPWAISVNLVNLVMVIPQKYSKVVFTADWFRITLCNWSWLTFVTGMTLVRIWKLVSISTI